MMRPARASEVLDGFESALLAGDATAMAALYEDDAVYYIPALGIVAKGRNAIEAQWARTFAQWRAISFEITDHELEVHDDLASSRLRATMTVEWHADRRREDIQVRAADVFRRGDDGVWRYAVDHA